LNSGFAVVAKAGATVYDDVPEGWPPYWPWPGPPWPPGVFDGTGMFSPTSPANGATGIDVDANLSWSFALSGYTYYVYLKSSSQPFPATSTPTTGQTDPASLLGSTSSATIDAGTMTLATTYYWQVVAIGALGVFVSPVWSFSTGTATIEEESSYGLYLLNAFYRPTTVYTGAVENRFAGSYYGFGGVNYVIHRRYCFFNIPAGTVCSSARLKIDMKLKVNDIGNFSIYVYSANADLYPIDVSDWGNLDNFEDEVLVSDVVTPGGATVNRSFTVSAARVNALAGGHVCFIIASKEDIDDNPPSTGGPPYKFVWLGDGTSAELELTS
jgi:hypothetical protein